MDTILKAVDLAAYQVDPVRGFLPSENPLQRLPPPFNAWEATAHDLSALIMTGRVRQTLEKLPVLDYRQLTDSRELTRAMLLLSVFAGAYVWGEAVPAARLPHTIAVPLWAVAEQLGRPPIISHSSMVLNNWRLLDPDSPIALDNLDTLQLFLGGMDEKWFYLATVGVEITGAPLILMLVDAQTAVTYQRPADLVSLFERMEAVLAATYTALVRIQEKCDPYIFYHRVRPFLTGWPAPGLIYEGVSDTPMIFSGGSAAQSSLIQVIDAGFGVQHSHPASAPFLMDMRSYMPPKHRAFVELIEAGPSIRQFVLDHQQDYPALRDGYNACIAIVDNFRKKHMEIAVRYISHQARNAEGAKGTGGTDFVEFLSAAAKETRARRVE